MTRGFSADIDSRRESARQEDGQFGVQAREEAVVSLDGLDWDDPTQMGELVTASTQMARNASMRTGSADRGYDVDDVAQDALVALLERKARDKSVDNVYAYVNTATSNVASKAGRYVRAEDFAAMRVFKNQRDVFTEEHGRLPSSTEEAKMAADIVATWYDPRHKPSVDFVNNVNGSKESTLRETTVDLFDREVSITGGSLDDGAAGNVRPGSHLDMALDMVENPGAGGRRDALKNVWNALAETQGAPLIDTPHLGHRAVSAARKTIPENTDVVALVERWENEQTSEEEERALFAPWPDTDLRQRAAVAGLLLRHRDYAYGMWDSAVKMATRPRGVNKAAEAQAS